MSLRSRGWCLAAVLCLLLGSAAAAFVPYWQYLAVPRLWLLFLLAVCPWVVLLWRFCYPLALLALLVSRATREPVRGRWAIATLVVIAWAFVELVWFHLKL